MKVRNLTTLFNFQEDSQDFQDYKCGQDRSKIDPSAIRMGLNVNSN